MTVTFSGIAPEAAQLIGPTKSHLRIKPKHLVNSNLSIVHCVVWSIMVLVLMYDGWIFNKVLIFKERKLEFNKVIPCKLFALGGNDVSVKE